MSFVHLNLHSEYSLLDSTCRVADIPSAVKAAGQSAAAITDRGNMMGAAAFFAACEAEGVHPIIGCEIYFDDNADRRERAAVVPTVLTLLAKDEVGYRNLCAIVSSGYTEGFNIRPIVDTATLERHNSGVICLSGGYEGAVSKYIISGLAARAELLALKLHSIFGAENFYLELQSAGLHEQKIANSALIELSSRHKIPCVITGDVHYLKKSDAEAHAALGCIASGERLSERGEFFGADELYLKTEAQIRAMFAGYNSTVVDEAIENTAKIAERCGFKFEFGKIQLPKFPLPEGQKSKSVLEKLAADGLQTLVNKGKIPSETDDTDEKQPSSGKSYNDYKYRMIYELMMIDRMGYNDYFLIVADFVRFARESGISVGPGRGSGAGSLVAYLVGIIGIDPVKYNLLFERFLNPERVSMPDFDIDFCYDRRDEVIAYVIKKYGANRVVQIAALSTLAPRAAVRDIGRVLGMSVAEIEPIVSRIPHEHGVTIKGTVEKDAGLRSVIAADKRAERLLTLAAQVEGLPRHTSIHAAGVVITERPTVEYIPVMTSGGTTVSQFEMGDIERLGLLKFDFLALRFLTVIQKAAGSARKRAPDFDIEKISEGDAKTFSLLERGNTAGLFQLESAGMTKLISRMKPRKIEDIMIAIALYRPGPMDAIPAFLEARTKKRGGHSRSGLPNLDDILGETSGFIVYQEQVMQIFRKVAGYSFGRADVIRRAMSKKKAAALEKEREDFISGAVKNGAERAAAERLFDEMASFAGYAFNKSHAAAYAVVAYRTAFLKANYPAEYFAALLGTTMFDRAASAEYIADAAKNGVKLIPPDINLCYDIPNAVSMPTAENPNGLSSGKITFGLAAVKGIGQAFVQGIVAEREDGGVFRSFGDFTRRMAERGMVKSQIHALIMSGCFDRFGVFRSKLAAVHEEFLGSLTRGSNRNIEGQTDLFASDSDTKNCEPTYPNIPEFSRAEIETTERELLGIVFYNPSKTVENARSAPNPRPISAPVSVPMNAPVKEAVNTPENAPVPQKNDRPKPAVLSNIYLRVPHAASREERRAVALCRLFPGNTEVIIYDTGEKKYRKCTPALTCSGDGFILAELREVLGDGNVVIR